jgi:hypothetical protein
LDVLTKEQLKEIADIIKDHLGVMLYAFVGNEEVKTDLLDKLGIPRDAPSLIQNSYILGKIIQMMSKDVVKVMTYNQLKEQAKRVSLTQMEQNSLRYAQEHSGEYVTALGQRITRNVNTGVVTASRSANLASAQLKVIRDTVSEAILNRETRGKLASELYHNNVEDWNRDWRRVAHTELWNARLQGEVASILEGDTIHGEANGGETNVFRRPSPDACNHCKRLYLEVDGVTPKVFTLSELIANGDNVGKKTAEWQPTTHTTHPNCTCPIAVLPDGFGFDEFGNLEFKE